MRTAMGLGQLERIILGTDSPAGSGGQPLGILRLIALLSSIGEVPAETVFCFATGNTARMRELDCGLVEPGRAADFVVMDRAQHTAGRTLLESVRMGRSEEHTSELQSLMRISYAVFCLKKKKHSKTNTPVHIIN